VVSFDHATNFETIISQANSPTMRKPAKQALLRAQRNGQAVGVVYLDLDRFKHVNGSYGHDIGDQVLVAVSCNMLEAIRDTDTLARMGGDEFVVVLAC
jgi:diguanylate cyclase (GGDEF)-like protein